MDYKEKVIAILNSQELSKEQKEKLELIFPELKESEDEKIKKALIWHLTRVDNEIPLGAYHSIDGIEIKDMLAWLERQVEQKLVDDADDKAEKEKNDYVSGQFLYCKGSFNEFKEGGSYWIEYIGNDTYIGRSDNILNQKFHITPRQLYTWLDPRHPEKQGEQKPAWSEEDETTFKVILEELEKYIRLKQYSTPLSVYDLQWLKSIKDRIQPKQEWSEEDETTFKVMLEELEKYVMFKQYSTPLSVYDLQWFKSLKDRVQP